MQTATTDRPLVEIIRCTRPKFVQDPAVLAQRERAQAMLAEWAAADRRARLRVVNDLDPAVRDRIVRRPLLARLFGR